MGQSDCKEWQDQTVSSCIPVVINRVERGRIRGRTSNESVTGLKLEGIFGIVDEGESSRLSTSKGGPESKDDDEVLFNLVHGCEFGAEFVTGDVGSGRVQDVYDHLLALEQTVGEKLAGADGDSSSGVLWLFCLCVSSVVFVSVSVLFPLVSHLLSVLTVLTVCPNLSACLPVSICYY